MPAAVEALAAAECRGSRGRFGSGPATGATFLGPSFDPEELAGRKLVALFNRAETRDFSDVHALAVRYGKALLMERAVEVDAGFDPKVLAQMLRSLRRFTDDQLPVGPDEVNALRSFFAEWASELDTG